ncbi:putative Phosphoglucosamine mutase [Candidatus Xenohaliotis californiensis]|uniref:Phosphoglucosamine mutase n=1 Tax=Candidatus Xenohaliotis californiensis TaxID=84677 RepID=A0ABP0EUL2_9RICK|nr:putative Phosphoglucosamine mutase [Candidatus Xenohaliotis californiensis]
MVLNNLFGTDGIRGKVGEFPIIYSFTIKLGISLAILLQRRLLLGALAIGMDTRTSSKSLAKFLALGANTAGLDVYFCGVVPSMAVAIIAKNNNDISVGCMVSASHNQFCDNGFKFFDSNGIKFSKDMEFEFTKIVSSIDDDLIKYSVAGIYCGSKFVSLYYNFIDSLAASIIKNPKLKIVFDCANGSLSFCTYSLFLNKIFDLVCINNLPNGCNINLDCGSEFPLSLSQKVVEHCADLGFAFDGDGDRLVVCDEFGKVIDFNYVMALLILFNKEKYSDNNGFVSTNMVNNALLLFAKKNDIPFFLSDVGDSNVSSLMHKKKCRLGGESSGHFIFNEFCIASDSLVSAIKIIEALQFFNLQPSEMQKFFTLNPQKIYNYYYSNYAAISGLLESNIFKEFVGNMLDTKIFIRFSGTEKCLRIVVSAMDIDDVDSALKDIINFIDSNFEYS